MPVKKAIPLGAKPSTDLVKWDERLAQLAEAAVKIEAGTGGESNFLGTRGGVLTFQKEAIPGNKINVIVIDHVLENAYREGKFDPDNPQVPVCFAFGRDITEMAPHEKSIKSQHPQCDGCPNNEWGSADTGKGMACGTNRRRLALITESDLENIAKAQVVYLSLSYFSAMSWKSYVRELKDTLHKPALAVITEAFLHPDPKAQFKFDFKMVREITDSKLYEGLWAKYEKVTKEIAFPYIQMSSTAPAAPKSNGKTPRRKF